MSLCCVEEKSKLNTVEQSLKLSEIEFVKKKYPQWTALFERKDQALH